MTCRLLFLVLTALLWRVALLTPILANDKQPTTATHALSNCVLQRVLFVGEFSPCDYCYSLFGVDEPQQISRSLLNDEISSQALVPLQPCGAYDDDFKTQCIAFGNAYGRIWLSGLNDSFASATEYCTQRSVCSTMRYHQPFYESRGFCDNCKKTAKDALMLNSEELEQYDLILALAIFMCNTLKTDKYNEQKCVAKMIQNSQKISKNVTAEELDPAKLCKWFGTCTSMPTSLRGGQKHVRRKDTGHSGRKSKYSGYDPDRPQEIRKETFPGARYSWYRPTYSKPSPRAYKVPRFSRSGRKYYQPKPTKAWEPQAPSTKQKRRKVKKLRKTWTKSKYASIEPAPSPSPLPPPPPPQLPEKISRPESLALEQEASPPIEEPVQSIESSPLEEKSHASPETPQPSPQPSPAAPPVELPAALSETKPSSPLPMESVSAEMPAPAPSEEPKETAITTLSTPSPVVSPVQPPEAPPPEPIHSPAEYPTPQPSTAQAPTEAEEVALSKPPPSPSPSPLIVEAPKESEPPPSPSPAASPEAPKESEPPPSPSPSPLIAEAPKESEPPPSPSPSPLTAEAPKESEPPPSPSPAVSPESAPIPPSPTTTKESPAPPPVELPSPSPTHPKESPEPQSATAAPELPFKLPTLPDIESATTTESSQSAKTTPSKDAAPAPSTAIDS